MKRLLSAIIGAAMLAGIALAQSADYSTREVRDPVKFKAKLNSDMGNIESRIAAVEATEVGNALAEGKIIVGSAEGLSAAVTPSGGIATLSAAGAVTLDGEYIANDTIDDDSIDFADVTGADLTLTDCGPITISSGNLTLTSGNAVLTSGNLTLSSGAATASGLIKGGTLGIGNGVLTRSGNGLLWIEGGVTNVLDADVTSP